MTKIGLAYINGAVPGFEDFGNLPTDIVKENGLVNGNKASDELDALIAENDEESNEDTDADLNLIDDDDVDCRSQCHQLTTHTHQVKTHFF
jgi:hypothetical protein